MAGGLFTSKGGVGRKMRKLREEEGQIANIRPELAPSSPERQLIKSPVEKIVPQGSAKMVAVRPTISQVAQDVTTNEQRSGLIGGRVEGSIAGGGAAPPGVRGQGAVVSVTDKPISKEVARDAAMDEIRSEVEATRPPVTGEAAIAAPVQAPPQVQAPQQEIKTTRPLMPIQDVPLYDKATRIGATYIGRPVSGRYTVQGDPTREELVSTANKGKSKRWWGSRFA